jgi:hypothetical protein
MPQQENEHERSLLDAALASGLAVAVAGPDPRSSGTRGRERHASPIGRRQLAASFWFE